MAFMLHGNIKVLPVRKAIHIIVKQPSRTDKIRMGLKYMFQLNNTSILFSLTVLQK